MNERRHYIICYDISDKRRLQRLHSRLKKLATPLQYSVFLFEGTPTHLEQCLGMLERIIHPKEDDLRAYPLPQRGHKKHFGPSVLPEGILWCALPAPWRAVEEANPRLQSPSAWN